MALQRDSNSAADSRFTFVLGARPCKHQSPEDKFSTQARAACCRFVRAVTSVLPRAIIADQYKVLL